MSEKPGMLVPARIYATRGILQAMDSGVFDQVTNVACLPGIRRYALCMPDGHWGYGFPIGGVAAFDVQDGVISPGGVGYDINCGMRLIRTDLTLADVQPHLETTHDRTLSKSAGRRRGKRIRSTLGGRISSRDDPWGQVVCGTRIRVASGSRPHGRRWLHRGSRSVDGDRPRDPTRHQPAGDLGIGQSLSRSPGGLERADIRSGHGCGAWHHRPRADRRDGALWLARVRPSGGERLS